MYTIRKLEWVEYPQDHLWTVKRTTYWYSTFGDFMIENAEDDHTHIWSKVSDYDEARHQCDSFEQATQECQVFHENKILEFLEPVEILPTDEEERDR